MRHLLAAHTAPPGCDFVAIFAESALIFRDLVCEVAGDIQRICNAVDPCFAADTEVIFTVGGGNMDQPHTVAGADISVVEDPETPFSFEFCKVGEQGLILPALQVGALEFSDDLILLFLLEERGDALFCHDITCLLFIGQITDDGIVDFGTGADGKVFGQSPGGSGPDEQVGIAPGSIGA